MLTLYRSAKVSSQYDSDSDTDEVIPAGIPYLTKINGKLVMARDRKDRPKGMALDLLGEAFGTGTRIIRRSRSVDRPHTSLLIDGVRYIPQPQPIYSAPLLQQPFPPPVYQAPQFSPYVPQPQLSLPASQPLQSAPAPHPARPSTPSQPTEEDFELLRRFDAHFNKLRRTSSSHISEDREKSASKTTIRITKHICANCGRLRSRKFHLKNQIKAGEEPVAAFCRKCQRDASSTSSSGSSIQAKKQKAKNENLASNKKNDTRQSSEKDDRSVLTIRNEQRKPSTKEAVNPRREMSSEEHIYAEREISENEGPTPRGRPRQRAEINEPIVNRALWSPLPHQRVMSRSPSNSRHERYAIPVKKSQRRRPEPPHLVKPFYRYVEVRREPSPSLEETFREPRYTYYSSYEEESQPRSVLVDYSVEERDGERSDSSHGSPQPRRRDRNNGTSQQEVPQKQRRIRAQRPEEIAVTETFTYQPRLSNLAERRSNHTLSDRSSIVSRLRAPKLEAEEASRYYHDDWSRVETVAESPRPRRRREIRHTYRRDEYEASELGRESSDSREYVRHNSRGKQTARAPSTVSSMSNREEIRRTHVKFRAPESSARSVAQWVEAKVPDGSVAGGRGKDGRDDQEW